MNMKKNKKRTGIICVVALLLLGGITYEGYMNYESPYRVEIIRTEDNGYGYKIYEGKRAIIVQPFVPAVAGKNSFKTEQDARNVGNLVLARIKSGDDFSISKADLKQLGVSWQEQNKYY